jgi:site-specific recombinase XerD
LKKRPEMSTFLAQNGTDSRHRTGSSASQPKLSDSEKLSLALPRGIKIGTWKNAAQRRKPYFVRYGTNRALESFVTEEARNTRAEELALKTEKHGTDSLNVRGADVAEWTLFKAETGATMAQVREMWARHEAQRAKTMTVQTAVDTYLALRLSEDIDKNTNTYRQMRRHLVDVLSVAFGTKRLAEVTATDLRELLAKTKNRDGTGPALPITKKGYRKNWMTFFTRACAEKWITENPCAAVVPPKVSEKEKELLGIKRAFEFLKANLSEPVMPRVALEMWGYMRASSAGRVLKEHVNFEEKGLRMPGKLHKSKKGKFRQGHSPVLWEWLARATDETWELSEKMYAVRKSQAFLRAGIQIVNREVHNVLRHSCISYTLAAIKNTPHVCYMAQHSSLKVTEGYEGVATERDGKLWEKLTPKAVAGTWEDFQKLNQQPEGTE